MKGFNHFDGELDFDAVSPLCLIDDKPFRGSMVWNLEGRQFIGYVCSTGPNPRCPELEEAFIFNKPLKYRGPLLTHVQKGEFTAVSTTVNVRVIDIVVPSSQQDDGEIFLYQVEKAGKL